MKKSFVIILALISASLLLGAVAFANAQTEKTVYVCEGGTGDGSSDKSPLGSLKDAYDVLGDKGGVVVICGKYFLGDNFIEPAHTGEIVVTQKYNGKDYRDGQNNTVYVKSQGKRYALGGPTTFENINFKGDLSAANNYILFVAQFNPIVMGDGVESIDFTTNLVAKGLTILGGVQGGYANASTVSKDLDAKITVKSGKFIIAGFSRQDSSTFTGCAHINISGGEITTLYAGSVNAGKGGDALINISGGVFTGTITASNINPSFLKGNARFNVTGGDFSSCKGIVGNIESDSEIDISKHPDEAKIKPLLSDFDRIITSDGEDRNVPITEAFKSGSFTDSKGTVIPYRYYVPENYDANKKYPVLLYMHGNGSRGSDNEIQLTTNGAALNTKIYNSDYECIMIAPQCPSGSEWVANGTYPGSSGFISRKEMGKHLSAAKELFDKLISEYSVDMNRLYVTGSSNGGGATWELIYRFPDLFAAAVPLAGTGSSDGADEYAKGLGSTKIWTFHGDADATLSVNGTRSVVRAIEALDKDKVKYTEYKDADHNVWSTAANTPGLVDWIFAQVKDGTTPPVDNGGEDVGADTSSNTTIPSPDTNESTQKPQDSNTEGSSQSTQKTENSSNRTDEEKDEFPLMPVIAIATALCGVAVIVVVLIKKKK